MWRRLSRVGPIKREKGALADTVLLSATEIKVLPRAVMTVVHGGLYIYYWLSTNMPHKARLKPRSYVAPIPILFVYA